MKVMLDHSVRTRACIADGAIQEGERIQHGKWTKWMKRGWMMKVPDKNLSRQREIDALFTIGRLIREGAIEAYTYPELQVEAWNDTRKPPYFNAFEGCRISICESALERSHFVKTIKSTEYMSKGGKKTVKAISKDHDVTQIGFFKWLCTLNDDSAALLAETFGPLGLPEYDVQGLKELQTFRRMCQLAGSEENYPDMFHLWTAHRANVSRFLTIDLKLINICESLRISHSGPKLVVRAITPTLLLNELRVNDLDPIPMKQGEFYPLGFPMNTSDL